MCIAVPFAAKIGVRNLVSTGVTQCRTTVMTSQAIDLDGLKRQEVDSIKEEKFAVVFDLSATVQKLTSQFGISFLQWKA